MTILDNQQTDYTKNDWPGKPKAVMGFTCGVESLTLVASSNLSGIADFRKVGHLVDDCAPFSAIGEMKLHIIEKDLSSQPMLEHEPEIFCRI